MGGSVIPGAVVQPVRSARTCRALCCHGVLTPLPEFQSDAVFKLFTTSARDTKATLLVTFQWVLLVVSQVAQILKSTYLEKCNLRFGISKILPLSCCWHLCPP